MDPEQFFGVDLPRRARALAAVLRNRSSVGSVAFHVEGAGTWSLRLLDGVLEVGRDVEDDVVLQLLVTLDDFGPLVVSSVEQLSEDESSLAGRMSALKALSVDAETARLVRHVPGSVLLVVRDGDVRRRLLLSPGRREPNLDQADCTIECEYGDLLDVQAGRQDAMSLFVAGKLKLSGNVQIAMAMSSLFV